MRLTALIVYTINAIESMHMQLRKIIKNRGHFPSDEAASKLLYLALRNICRLSPGGKQSISSPFCSASDSPPPSTETFDWPQHTKFLTRSVTESFFSTLKTERVNRRVYRARDEARADVFDYIERFYNPHRRHSTLNFLGPVQFEQRITG